MLFLKIGFRNLLRNKRRTLLTMSAMILANAFLIFVLSMNEGMIWDLINNSTEVIHGHVSITAKGYLDQPSINLTVPETADFRNEMLQKPQVKGLCGRVSCFALLSAGQDEACRTLPSEILGIDPGEEQNVSRLSKSVIAGHFLTTSDSPEVLLGKGLARNLNATVGDEIVLMGQAADGSTAAELFKVSGIIDTGSPPRDASLALFGRKKIQDVFCLDQKIHTWSVFLKDPLQAETVASELKSSGMVADFSPWQKLLPQIAQVFKFLGIIQYICMVFFYFAVFLVSSNTMYMAFLERMREFAIVRALGLSPRKLSGLLLLEGLLLSSFSALVGTLLGLAISTYFRHFPFDLGIFLPSLSYGGTSIQPRIICQASAHNIFMPFFTMVCLEPLVALLPIFRLWGLRPVEALRNA